MAKSVEKRPSTESNMTQRRLKKDNASQAIALYLRVSASILLGPFACGAPQRATEPAIPLPTYADELAAAEAVSDSGDWERALKLADALVAKAPRRPGAYLLRGRALALGDQLEASAEAYGRAYALGDRSARLYAELTSVDDVLGRYGAAAALYREYLAAFPNDLEMRQQLALTLMLPWGNT